MEKVETQTPLAIFKPQELQVPTRKLKSTKGQPFEFGLGIKLV